MPLYSHRRRAHLYSVDECAALTGKTRRTIQRYLEQDSVYREYHQVRFGRGSSRTVYVDPLTLPGASESADVVLLASTTTEQNDIPPAQRHTPALHHGQPLTESRPSVGAKESSGDTVARVEKTEHKDRDVQDLKIARERFDMLQSLLRQPPRARRQAVEETAQAEGVSPRTIYRWLAQFKEEGLRGLQRNSPSIAGRPSIPPEAYQLIVAALVTNPPATPSSMIHRTLIRAAPDAMRNSRGGKKGFISERTVHRVRRGLEADPRTRLLFFDADRRREYLRTYTGEVVSAHANDLWQMDMTRCDTMVIDPESGRTFRPRVHAIIDVYSGCIPAIVFSTEENQVQTDLAILRAVLPKSGPYAEKYPVFGVPRRLYLDNGKTYTSEQAHRVLGGLGVEVVHSLPRVSHTRGRIERFFGTLHSFERSLPGYVGKDARDRAAQEIKRLTRNTLAWLGHGRDPGEGERLLTIAEYQNFVLAWLVAEYHAWPVHGKTRLEHFTETAPARSQAILDRAELMLLFAERTARVVEPSGTIRLDNQRWSISDGSLIKFQGKNVLVLRDQFTLGEDRRLVVWKDRHGRLEVIGEATPAPSVADSLEAGELRRASKAQAQRALRDAKRQARDLMNPELRVSKQLMKEVEVVLEPTLPPTPRGRVAAVNPSDPREDLDPEDPLVRHLQDPFANGVVPADPVERLRGFVSAASGRTHEQPAPADVRRTLPLSGPQAGAFGVHGGG